MIFVYHVISHLKWFVRFGGEAGTRSRDKRSAGFSPHLRRSRSWVSTTETKHLRGKSNWGMLLADRVTRQLDGPDVFFKTCKNLSQLEPEVDRNEGKFCSVDNAKENFAHYLRRYWTNIFIVYRSNNPYSATRDDRKTKTSDLWRIFQHDPLLYHFHYTNSCNT